MIILIGSLLAMFYVFLLLGKKGKTAADFVLMAWMLLMAMHLLVFYSYTTKLYEKYPFVLGLDMAFPMMHAVFLFLYVKLLTSEDQIFHWFDYLHFMPSILIYIYMIPFMAMERTEKLLYFNNIKQNESVFLGIVLIIVILSGIAYIGLSLIMLHHHSKTIVNRFSFTEQINLNWMKRLIYGMLIIWTIVIFTFFTENIFGFELPGGGDYYIFHAVILFVFFLGFYGIRQTAVFTNYNRFAEATDTVEVAEIQERYKKSGLKDSQIEELKEKLEQLMTIQKLYLEPKLSLDDVASKLDIHPNYLSQLINSHFNKNFFEFINQFRVQEFKRIAMDPSLKHYSILALAFDAGFSSKSTFNTVFKKYSGITPSEYVSSIDNH